MSARYFGARVARLEDPDLLTGRGRYLDDIEVPGTLEGAFVRSPHAHARIRAIGKGAAEALPGVVAVLTAADLDATEKPMPPFAPSPLIKQNRIQHVLAVDEACYVGEAVVLVVAQTRAIAEDACELVEVDYEPLPICAELASALLPGAPKAHADAPDNRAATMRARFGNADQIFAGAPHVFRERIVQTRGGCHAMECRGVLAVEDALSGQLTVFSSTQAPYMVRRALAGWMGLDESRIRVAAPHVGGGFGPKAGIYAEEFAVTLAARKLHRPVKWVEDRREHFLATNQQRDEIWELEAAADENGRLLAVRGTCLHDNGAYLPYGLVLPATLLAPFPGPYGLQALDVTLDVVFTNKVPTSPVRGAGRPNVAFVLERLADRVARELHLDRAEVRRRSFVRADQFPYKTGMLARDGSPVVYDSGDYAACLDAALQRIDAAGFPARQAQARNEGHFIGMGLASYVEDTGLPPFEGAAVKIERNGSVLISTGAASQGQGHQTMLAQIAADVLAIPIERIRVASADTGAFPHGIGTIGSRVAATAGPSVHVAAHKVRDKAIKLAADMLEAAETDLVLADGFVRVAGTDKSIELSDIARRTEGDAAMPLPPGVEPGLAATAYHEARATTFASGTNVAEVEVDSDTGVVKVLRYVVAHDCGKLINPLLVDGQIRGGVVHGIGNALFERMVYDEEAQPLSTNYADYLLPSAPEMPRVEIMHLEHPSPLNPIGVKGAGEGGTIPAAACIVSAIEDALAPFGVRLAEHPLSPEAILAAIRNASAQP